MNLIKANKQFGNGIVLKILMILLNGNNFLKKFKIKSNITIIDIKEIIIIIKLN